MSISMSGNRTRSPKINTGMRSQDREPVNAVSASDMVAQAEYLSQLQAFSTKEVAGKKERIYHSLTPGLRVQIKNTKDRVDVDGFRIEGESLAIQFKDGVYRLDPEDSNYDTIVKRLEGNRKYNITYWDAAVKAEEQKVLLTDSIINTVKQNPRLAATLKGAFDAGTFGPTLQASA